MVPGWVLGAARALARGKARVPGLVMVQAMAMAMAMASASARVMALAPAQVLVARWVLVQERAALVQERAALAAGCCPGSRHRRRRRR